MQTKKKCLVFYTYLPPWRIDIFNAMEDMFDLTIVFLHVDADGFKYNTETLLNRLHSRIIIWNKGFLFKSILVRFGMGYLILKNKPEVVYSHEYSPTSILLSFYRKLGLFNFRLVITTSDNETIIGSHSKIKRLFRKFVLRNSDGLVVYSENVRKLYQIMAPELRIQVCPNIQNPESLLALRSAKRSCPHVLPEDFILFVGRLEYVKGVDVLIEGFAALNDSKLNLVIVGKGSLRKEYEQMVNHKGLTERVLFINELYGPDLMDLYSSAKFLILPSRWEPFGAVVNEALVFGCPVLLSRFAGSKVFIKEGYNGFLTDPTDQDRFSSDLRNMLDHFTIRLHHNLMIESFQDRVKAFTNVLDEN